MTVGKIAELIAAEVAAAERASDQVDGPLPKRVRVSRGHDRSRPRVMNVKSTIDRVTPGEGDELSAIGATLTEWNEPADADAWRYL